MKKTAMGWMVAAVAGVLLAVPAASRAAPWAEMFGEELTNAQGEKVEVKALEGKELVAVYFSAHWCPPCRAFTPKLVEAYTQWRKDGKPIALVFVSSDRSAEAMQGYMKEVKMPWLAVPFRAAPGQALAAKHNIRGIPSLLVFNAQGELVSANARGEVQSKGAGAIEAWMK
jgi:nucleoredoxin